MQADNRKLRQELSAVLAQLTECQDNRREAETARGRLEAEIHKLSRLRGEAEMARSDAERQLRDIREQLSVKSITSPASLRRSRTHSGRTRKHRQSLKRLVRCNIIVSDLHTGGFVAAVYGHCKHEVHAL